MKLNTNIQWGEFEKRGFFKIYSIMHLGYFYSYLSISNILVVFLN